MPKVTSNSWEAVWQLSQKAYEDHIRQVTEPSRQFIEADNFDPEKQVLVEVTVNQYSNDALGRTTYLEDPRYFAKWARESLQAAESGSSKLLLAGLALPKPGEPVMPPVEIPGGEPAVPMGPALARLAIIAPLAGSLQIFNSELQPLQPNLAHSQKTVYVVLPKHHKTWASPLDPETSWQSWLEHMERLFGEEAVAPFLPLSPTSPHIDEEGEPPLEWTSSRISPRDRPAIVASGEEDDKVAQPATTPDAPGDSPVAGTEPAEENTGSAPTLSIDERGGGEDQAKSAADGDLPVAGMKPVKGKYGDFPGKERIARVFLETYTEYGGYPIDLTIQKQIYRELERMYYAETGVEAAEAHWQFGLILRAYAKAGWIREDPNELENRIARELDVTNLVRLAREEIERGEKDKRALSVLSGISFSNRNFDALRAMAEFAKVDLEALDQRLVRSIEFRKGEAESSEDPYVQLYLKILKSPDIVEPWVKAVETMPADKVSFLFYSLDRLACYGNTAAHDLLQTLDIKYADKPVSLYLMAKYGNETALTALKGMAEGGSEQAAQLIKIYNGGGESDGFIDVEVARMVYFPEPDVHNGAGKKSK